MTSVTVREAGKDCCDNGYWAITMGLLVTVTCLDLCGHKGRIGVEAQIRTFRPDAGAEVEYGGVPEIFLSYTSRIFVMCAPLLL